jgi:hypothetical protein
LAEVAGAAARSAAHGREPKVKVLGGLAALAVVGLLAGAIGCGGGDEVAEGAVVHVYVSAPLCGEAKAAASGEKGDAGGVRARVRCLPPSEGRGGVLDLVAIGSGTRGAVQDSSSVALIEARGRANSFSRPILDEAEVALVAGGSGSRAMAMVLAALEARGGEETPREAVWGALAG